MTKACLLKTDVFGLHARNDGEWICLDATTCLSTVLNSTIVSGELARSIENVLTAPLHDSLQKKWISSLDGKT